MSVPQQVKALYDYKSSGGWKKNGLSDISIRRDDILTVLDPPDAGWIKVRHESNSVAGYVPSNYVQKITAPPSVRGPLPTRQLVPGHHPSPSPQQSQPPLPTAPRPVVRGLTNRQPPPPPTVTASQVSNPPPVLPRPVPQRLPLVTTPSRPPSSAPPPIPHRVSPSIPQTQDSNDTPAYTPVSPQNPPPSRLRPTPGSISNSVGSGNEPNFLRRVGMQSMDSLPVRKTEKAEPVDEAGNKGSLPFKIQLKPSQAPQKSATLNTTVKIRAPEPTKESEQTNPFAVQLRSIKKQASEEDVRKPRVDQPKVNDSKPVSATESSSSFGALKPIKNTSGTLSASSSTEDLRKGAESNTNMFAVNLKPAKKQPMSQRPLSPIKDIDIQQDTSPNANADKPTPPPRARPVPPPRPRVLEPISDQQNVSDPPQNVIENENANVDTKETPEETTIEAKRLPSPLPFYQEEQSRDEVEATPEALEDEWADHSQEHHDYTTEDPVYHNFPQGNDSNIGCTPESDIEQVQGSTEMNEEPVYNSIQPQEDDHNISHPPLPRKKAKTPGNTPKTLPQELLENHPRAKSPFFANFKNSRTFDESDASQPQETTSATTLSSSSEFSEEQIGTQLTRTESYTSDDAPSPSPESSPAVSHRSSLRVGTEGEEQTVDGMSFITHKGKTVIKGATLNELVERLYGDAVGTEFVTEYADTFLLTYRAFTTSIEIFQMISNTYVNCGKLGEADDDVRAKKLRICNFLKRWVENHYYDFEGDTDLLALYEQLIVTLVGMGTEQTIVNVLRKAMHKGAGRFITMRKSKRSFTIAPPRPILPKQLGFHDIDAIEIARQLTLYEFELFSSISTKEFLLAKSWQRVELAKRAPRILRMIEQFNVLSNWVCYTIVTESNLKKRAQILLKFIRISKECLAVNNFNAVFSIIAGLQQSPVHRLKKTWDIVRKEKDYRAYDEMLSLTSSRGSFQLYRERLHNSDPPCIPYLGIYQTDLTFIQDGNPDFLDSSGQVINFFKRRLVAEVIREIKVFQQRGYNFHPVEAIITWIQSQEAISMDENSLYNLSLEIEPRDGGGTVSRGKSPSSFYDDANNEQGVSPVTKGLTRTKSKITKFFGEDIDVARVARTNSNRNIAEMARESRKKSDSQEFTELESQLNMLADDHKLQHQSPPLNSTMPQKKEAKELGDELTKSLNDLDKMMDWR